MKIFKAPLILLLFVTFAFSGTWAVSQTTDEQVLRFAEIEYPLFLKSIPPGKESMFGFTNSEEVNFCKLTMPYQLYNISAEQLTAKKLNPEKLLIPIDEWKVPVVYRNGDIKTFLNVMKVKDELLSKSFVGAILAKEMSKNKPELERDIAKKVLIISSDNTEYIFLIKNNEKLSQGRIYPLQSAKRKYKKFTIPGKEFFTLKEFVSILKNKKK